MERLKRSAGVIVVSSGVEPPEILLLDQVRATGERQTVAPKGGIKPGETPVAAARRELQEEAGISELTYVAYLGQDSYDVVGKDGTPVAKTVDWFLGLTGQRHVEPQAEEGFVRGRWVPLDEAAEVASHDSFRAFLRRAGDMIDRRRRDATSA